jgi:hypothetical protein
MEVDLHTGFVRFYCQVNLEKYKISPYSIFAIGIVLKGQYYRFTVGVWKRIFVRNLSGGFLGWMYHTKFQRRQMR